jgi:hypothetical protein
MVTDGELLRARLFAGLLDAASAFRAERPWMRTGRMFRDAKAGVDAVFDDPRLSKALESGDAHVRAVALQAREALATLAEHRAIREGTTYDDERRTIYDRPALGRDLSTRDPAFQWLARKVVAALGELSMLSDVFSGSVGSSALERAIARAYENMTARDAGVPG